MELPTAIGCVVADLFYKSLVLFPDYIPPTKSAKANSYITLGITHSRHQFSKPLYNTLACQNIAVGWSPSLPLHSWDRIIAHTVLTNVVFFRCPGQTVVPRYLQRIPELSKAMVSTVIVLFFFVVFSGEIPGNHKHKVHDGELTGGVGQAREIITFNS